MTRELTQFKLLGEVIDLPCEITTLEELESYLKDFDIIDSYQDGDVLYVKVCGILEDEVEWSEYRSLYQDLMNCSRTIREYQEDTLYYEVGLYQMIKIAEIRGIDIGLNNQYRHPQELVEHVSDLLNISNIHHVDDSIRFTYQGRELACEFVVFYKEI